MSDQSSIISISERMAASDTDDGRNSIDDHIDTRKYLVPDDESVQDSPSSPGPQWTQRDRQATGYAFDPLSREETPLSYHINNNNNNQLSSMQDDAGSESSATDHSDDPPDFGFGHGPVSRPASIFSLSRLSFTNQLAELTSIKLPNAVSLSHRISSMSTSAEAARALSDSAEQIQLWIRKALKVLEGLNAEDDVEWAAAAGREGLDDVDKAIGRFERVIKVYIFSVEELQMRDDIAALPRQDLTRNVSEMEVVLKEWQSIKDGLDGIKTQVEIAMEWEELWNHVLGAGIGQELDELARLVFEMEEKRHQSVVTDAALNTVPAIDIDELKTIVEETTTPATKPINQRYSLPAPFSPTPPISSTPALGNVEDHLLGLFARMQPLRASLDFLPMRLSVFHCRGNPIFPSACLVLESRRDMLEAQWKKLEADAEALRRELGEDRWLLVFRNAGLQAQKMCESVSRTMEKLRTGIRNGEQKTDGPAIARKIESYEAKKTHYCPAIDRVLAIIDRGVLDRLTVNGEILGLQSDMKRRWSALQADMRHLDSTLADMNVNMRNQQLRDSISTILSSEQSMASSLVDTPRSSSASSLSARSSLQKGSTPRRSDRLFKSSIPRRLSMTHAHTPGLTRSPLTQPPRPISPTLTPVPFLRQFKPPSDKPRWNGSTSTRGSGIGHNFSPFSVTEPSPYSKGPPPRRAITPSSAPSKIPAPSSASPRAARASPAMQAASPVTPASVRYSSSPASSPLAVRSRSSLGHKQYSANGRSTPLSNLSYGRSVTTPVLHKRNELLAPSEHDPMNSGVASRKPIRPPSALAVPSGRKSALPTERGGTRTRASMGTEDGIKPRWK